jgi:hypothetical protein
MQGLFAHTAQHRSVSIPDLLTAATAERHGLTRAASCPSQAR